MNDNMNNNNGVQNEQVSQFPQQPQQYQQQYAPAPVHQAQGMVQPVNCDTPMNVTSLADLQRYSQGTVVRFPDFNEGQHFIAKVRRPSLLMMAKSGQIPNSLLTSAGDLFTNGAGNKNANEDTLSQMYDVCRLVCKACLLQPTLDEIEAAGMELSDDQIMAIFNFSQVGVKALDSFRKE